MKKFLVAAMMVLGATSAFAGDSDALKAVMKAKSYAEAEALVKQNLGQMANDAEKAKAYNKLVDLAMKQFNDQQSIQQTNQLMKKNDPVDEVAMSLASQPPHSEMNTGSPDFTASSVLSRKYCLWVAA